MAYSSMWDTVGQPPTPDVYNIANPMYDPAAQSPFAGGWYERFMAPAIKTAMAPGNNIQWRNPNQIGSNLNIGTTGGNNITAADVNAAFAAGTPQPSLFAGNALPPMGGMPQAPVPAAAAPAMAPQAVDPLMALRATEFNMTPGINPNGSVDMNSINTAAAVNGTTSEGGMFSDMTGGDWLGVGVGLLNTGIGAYFQNRQMGLAEDELALSQQKFDTYLADRQRLLDADKRRLAASGG